ncbi:helix-turn-helix domain-containing protein (plasmid) [Moraxella atlantae]|uniref:helix-turn-helix domain-containing protein n=1 Tax=Faucicola atlantae TaxID=34059 RepID=UPI0037508E4E
MKINEKIRLLREKNHFTQEDMANRLQLSTNGYANIERGETKLTFERLEQIAEIFDIDVTELVSYGEQNAINYVHSTSNHSLNIVGQASNELLEAEILKLNLVISHKDELLENQKALLAQQKQQIDTLNLLVATLQNK